ncbi:MAG TPA: hypothetical protein VN892_13045 [Solirubrobacteraceae bacterium]|nr:hypothetical protein [Solirubrobacteraceae bacterium]
MRIVLEAGQHGRDATVRFGDLRDPAARVAGLLAVGRASLVEHLQGIQRRSRLAGRATQVGLQRVAEATVRIAIATQHFDDRLSRPVGEQHAVAVAVHQAGGGPDEVLGGTAIDRHAADPRQQWACGL